MVKIATPISHLFNDNKSRERIIDHSDCLECRDGSILNDYPDQELFHCDIQPIHILSEKDFDYLKKIRKLKPHLKLISFHLACCCENPGIENNMFVPNGRIYSKDEMLANFKFNIKRMRDIFDADVDIAVENNNYYPTEAYRYVTDADFIAEIVHKNDILFLFDVAHAKITCHNRKITFSDYYNELPMKKAIQIHLSSFKINGNNIAYDSHGLPDEQDLEEFKDIISRTGSIKYLTIEYYDNTENLIKFLRSVRGIANDILR